MPGRNQRPTLIFFVGVLSLFLGVVLFSIAFYYSPYILTKHGPEQVPTYLEGIANWLIAHQTLKEKWHRYVLVAPLYIISFIFFFVAWISTKIMDRKELPGHKPVITPPPAPILGGEPNDRSLFEKYPLLTMLFAVIGVFLLLAVIEFLLGVML